MILTYPVALLGLLAATTPVVIYLLLRRRKTEMDWGASYLLRLTLRSKRKASIWKQMVVLALRVLVLTFGAALLVGLIWPNAQPSRERPALPPEPVHRTILVDNSLSMTASDTGSARLTRMQVAVDALLTDLRIGDYATVVPLVRGALGAEDDQTQTLAGPLSGRQRRAAIEAIFVAPGEVGLPRFARTDSLPAGSGPCRAWRAPRRRWRNSICCRTSPDVWHRRQANLPGLSRPANAVLSKLFR